MTVFLLLPEWKHIAETENLSRPSFDAPTTSKLHFLREPNWFGLNMKSPKTVYLDANEELL
jgi:hypothetical protein